jgi:lipopolysaccharide transport system permease protein
MIKALFTPLYWRAILVLTEAAMIRMNKNSILGSLWALIQPFVHMCVISYIFSILLRQSNETMVKNLAAGLPLWNFMATSLSTAANSLVSRENILKRYKTSKVMFIISDIAINIFTLGCSLLAMYLLFIILYFKSLSVIILLAPIVILPFIIAVMAVSVAVGFLAPYLRDIPQILTLALTTLYWSVPIVYPYSIVPQAKQYLFEYNPLFLLIRPLQVLFIEQRFPDPIHMIKASIVTGISIIVSYFIYRKLSRNVIYYI